jgi:hypothetical protein
MEERLVMTFLELISFSNEVLMEGSLGLPSESSGQTAVLTNQMLLVMPPLFKMSMAEFGCHFVAITKRSLSPFQMTMA